MLLFRFDLIVRETTTVAEEEGEEQDEEGGENAVSMDGSNATSQALYRFGEGTADTSSSAHEQTIPERMYEVRAVPETSNVILPRPIAEQPQFHSLVVGDTRGCMPSRSAEHSQQQLCRGADNCTGGSLEAVDSSATFEQTPYALGCYIIWVLPHPM